MKLLLASKCSEYYRGQALGSAAWNGRLGCIKLLTPSISWASIGIAVATSAVTLSVASRAIGCSEEARGTAS